MVGYGYGYPRRAVADNTPPPPPAAPENTSPPVIAGSTTQGERLTVNPGSWTGNPYPTFTRQWLRDGVAISGATGVEYVTVQADIGKSITCDVTGTNATGTKTARSNALGPITAVQTAPTKMAAPTVVPGDQRITVTRAAAPADGGSPITSYDLQVSANNGASWATSSGIGPTATVTGLINGTSYLSRTRAVNAVGAGEWSDATAAVPVAAQATVFRDNWDRPDGPVIGGSGGNWTLASGDTTSFHMAGGKLAARQNEACIIAPDLGNVNHYIQHVIEGGGNVGPFMCCRLTDQNNFGAGVRYNLGTGASQIWRRSAGALTQMGGNISGMTVAVGDVLRLEVMGDICQLVRNGVPISNRFEMTGIFPNVTRAGYLARTVAFNPWADLTEHGHLQAFTQ